MAGEPSTLLSIDGIDFSPYSNRGLTMTLEPIAQAVDLRRDCNGLLVDVSLAQFRKYRSTVTCTDQEAPTFTDVWPGKFVTVICIPDMGVSDGVGNTLTMEMLVVAWDTSRDEWGAELGWRLELEER
jgi:hypothetical protein